MVMLLKGNRTEDETRPLSRNEIYLKNFFIYIYIYKQIYKKVF